jgi:CheY-like chemotaxis protein
MTMPEPTANLLIVDDNPLMRTALSAVFTRSGYRVRSAQDGFAALAELRLEVPDLILSDLNMAGMSGFEFLSVVCRRFPAVRVVAMSGAYSGDEVPPGVMADAFYEKATSIAALLRIVEGMCNIGSLRARGGSGASAPIWLSTNGHDPAGKPFVMISCPECLRAFIQVLAETSFLFRETGCVHCDSPIQYAIVQPMEFARL